MFSPAAVKPLPLLFLSKSYPHAQLGLPGHREIQKKSTQMGAGGAFQKRDSASLRFSVSIPSPHIAPRIQKKICFWWREPEMYILIPKRQHVCGSKNKRTLKGTVLHLMLLSLSLRLSVKWSRALPQMVPATTRTFLTLRWGVHRPHPGGMRIMRVPALLQGLCCSEL